MSHRGLSGVGNKRKKNNAEGTTLVACSPFLGPVIMGVTCSLIQ
jgi:hypothetical protein